MNASPPGERVAINGASGLIGGNLSAFLTGRGCRVHRLVQPPKPETPEIRWDPERGLLP